MAEVFLSTKETSKATQRAVQRGLARKLGPRLYTSNMDDSPEQVIRRNLWQVIDAYAPGALIADRTALELAPADDGSIFIVSNRRRDVVLPGITIKSRGDGKPTDGDLPFMGGSLRLSSPHRSLLDNLRRFRTQRGSASRTLGQEGVEAYMERIAATGGADALGRIIDAASRIAASIGRESELRRLQGMFAELSGGAAGWLKTPLAKARAQGEPYDPASCARFDRMVAALRLLPRTAMRSRLEAGGEAWRAFAFFDAYFSNYIEGTELTLDEAAGIVFRGHRPPGREADAQDMAGLWTVLSNAGAMRRPPQTADGFLADLRQRHAIVMRGRPEAVPGAFKSLRNRIGAKEFVSPESVAGTLREGFHRLAALTDPFNRAVFMHFLIAEVHPFTDGNGRMARLMMNVELNAAGLQPILIPTAYRENYLAAQRSPSAGNAPETLPRALHRIQQWACGISWKDGVDAAARELKARHAFMTEAELDDLNLRLLDAPEDGPKASEPSIESH